MAAGGVTAGGSRKQPAYSLLTAESTTYHPLTSFSLLTAYRPPTHRRRLPTHPMLCYSLLSASRHRQWSSITCHHSAQYDLALSVGVQLSRSTKAPPTTTYYWLLIDYLPLLTTTYHYHRLLVATHYYSLLLTTTHYYYLLLTTYYHYLLLTTYYLLLPTTTYYYLLLLTTRNQFTAITFRLTTAYYCLLLTNHRVTSCPPADSSTRWRQVWSGA